VSPTAVGSAFAVGILITVLGGVAAWRRGGVAAWRRGGVAAWRRGGVAAWRRASVAASERGEDIVCPFLNVSAARCDGAPVGVLAGPGDVRCRFEAIQQRGGGTRGHRSLSRAGDRECRTPGRR
ncbi:hypothetical protein ACWD6Z_28880, partial [Streptomyces californicus]